MVSPGWRSRSRSADSRGSWAWLSPFFNHPWMSDLISTASGRVRNGHGLAGTDRATVLAGHLQSALVNRSRLAVRPAERAGTHRQGQAGHDGDGGPQRGTSPAPRCGHDGCLSPAEALGRALV